MNHWSYNITITKNTLNQFKNTIRFINALYALRFRMQYYIFYNDKTYPKFFAGGLLF